MGMKEIKNYLLNKFASNEKPTKYPLGEIYWAYTLSGNLMEAFVYNNSHTRIKDIATDKVIELDEGKKMSQALAELYNCDYRIINYDSNNNMLNNYTSASKIPGRVFKELRDSIDTSYASDRSIEINYFNNFSNGATYKDLLPLKRAMQTRLAHISALKANRVKTCEALSEGMSF